MVEQQQERSRELAALAALCLASQLGLISLFSFYSCSSEMCGLSLLGPAFVLVGTGAVVGIAAWLGTIVRAVRRHDGLSALSIGVLPLVALSNALLVNSHDVRVEQTSGLLALAGAWTLFSLVPATLLVISVMRRQATQHIVAVAGLILAVAVLVASNLVD